MKKSFTKINLFDCFFSLDQPYSDKNLRSVGCFAEELLYLELLMEKIFKSKKWLFRSFSFFLFFELDFFSGTSLRTGKEREREEESMYKKEREREKKRKRGGERERKRERERERRV
jgi:hypothetical protein